MSSNKIQHFPEKPQFSGFMKPCRFEGEAQNLEVYGDLPQDIDGTFFRVMPDPQAFPFVEDDPVCDTYFVKMCPILTISSGSTATAMSVPSGSRMAEFPGSSGLCGLKSSSGKEKQRGPSSVFAQF